MRSVLKAMLLCLVFGLSACAPRGETKSLDQVLADAKERYSATNLNGVNPDASGAVQTAVSKMNQIEAGFVAASLPEQAKEISDALRQVEPRAGYTSRPALDELIREYRELNPKTEAATAKLLVARTYNWLSSELETTRFGVN